MRFAFILCSLFVCFKSLSHYPSFPSKSSQDMSHHHISLHSWEIDFDTDVDHYGVNSENLLSEASGLSDPISFIEIQLNAIFEEISERDAFANQVSEYFAISSSINRSFSEGSFPDPSRPGSEEGHFPISKIFSSSWNQTISKNQETSSRNSERVFVKYKNDLESTQITKYSNIPFISKKLQKYYSIRRNAPPFGEEKC